MAQKFDGKAWAKGNHGSIKVTVRLIDGTDYEFEFVLLTGESALAVKREVFGFQKEAGDLVKEEKDKGREPGEREVDVSVRLSEIDQKVWRCMCRASVAETKEFDDDQLDLLLTSVGGIHSVFGKALYKACGVSHPHDVLRLASPDLLEDLPFLSRGKRARASRAGG